MTFRTKEELKEAALIMYVEGWETVSSRIDKVLASGLIDDTDWDYLLIRAILLEHAKGYVNTNNTQQKKVCKVVELL